MDVKKFQEVDRVQEAYYPVIIDKHELARDSCCAGLHRCGLGIKIILRSEDDAYLNTQFERTSYISAKRERT